MIKWKKALLAAALAAWTVLPCHSQTESSVRWSTASRLLPEKNRYELIVTGRISPGLHVYGLRHRFSATTLSLEPSSSFEAVGAPYEISKSTTFDKEQVFFREIQIGQVVALKAASAVIRAEIEWNACGAQGCRLPEEAALVIRIGDGNGSAVHAAGGKTSEEAAARTAEGKAAGIHTGDENGKPAETGEITRTDSDGTGKAGIPADREGKAAGKQGKTALNKNVIGPNSFVSSSDNQLDYKNNPPADNTAVQTAGMEQDSPAGQVTPSGQVSGTPSAAPTAPGKKTSLWALLIEAVLWGFAMLLTPCVFPMIPMTISFFMKGASSPRAGRFKAFMYGIFIVLLYTLPICLIIGITWAVGGTAVTADIFNWLATHWLPNLVFFLVFMVFAASFFGAFELTLPSSIVNKSDRNSDRAGLAGVFFMALTLVLVSFSCTGPIVGSVLIKSTQGEIWTPMITMLAFSVAFALPFTIFALFPSLLTRLKSGSWMNSVKVVLGFIEVALGFKFLSVPDQTYHWHLLDREVYLAIWIVVFSLLGLYLLGKIRFAHDDKVEKIGVFRLSLVILVFSFVVYMIPGMFGAPLKALSGYLPPMETQDFVMDGGGEASAGRTVGSETVRLPQNDAGEGLARKYHLKMPAGLQGYFRIEEGLAAARAAGKPLFVDITGYGCTNCREMEARVWSDARVMERLRNDFIVTVLYTDDKTRLEEEDWVVMDNGKIAKDLGRANAYIARTRFNVNAQPNYALLGPDGELLVPVRGYDLDVEGYLAFLQSGLDAFYQGRSPKE